ncbi:MAG: A24 family peptidase [Thiohalocapsa sp.]
MDYAQALAQMPVLLYAGTAALGLVIGSFLNVVILRLPRMMERDWRQECADLLADAADADAAASEQAPTRTPTQEPATGLASTTASNTASGAQTPLSLSKPGSSCPHCGHHIRPWENIPVVSFLLLRERCSSCGESISWRYPVIEVLTAVLSLVVIWQFGPTLQGAFALVLTWGLVALAAIDADTQLLPDDITLPLLWLGLLLSIPALFVDSQTAVIGAAAGYMSLWLVFHLFRLLTGKEGMGRGDFKLLALFGAWLGWQSLPQILLLSTIPGALFGIALVASGHSERRAPIAFGPFLAIAGWISLVWGEAITQAYLRWSGLA